MKINGFVVLGTDTDAGKTAFSLLWMTVHRDRAAYWKPVETGESDSQRIADRVPGATVFPPFARFSEPVSPDLAARRQGACMPDLQELRAAVPRTDRPLLIESFGSPLSPWTRGISQIDWLRTLGVPALLVTPSSVGAIGRSLQTLTALNCHGILAFAVVLLGPRDEYAESEIAERTGLPVFSLPLPTTFSTEELQQLASSHASTLAAIDRIRPQPSLDASTLVERDRRSIWHPYTPLIESESPLPVLAAEAEFLHLADGRRIVDAISSWWTIQHGHRHPPMMQALREAMESLDHVLFAGATHPSAVELAEMLLKSVGWSDGGRVFYSDNGSTAVEVALKLAYQTWCVRGQPQRTLFVGFEDGYHGDTFGAMAAGRDPVFFSRFDPLLFRTLRVPVDPDALAAVLDEHSDQVAAVILEPLVQGAGGMRMHSPETLRRIAQVTQQRGHLFIADEVMTGGGRTGSLWACDSAQVKPDLICAAKTLTGGIMPLAATLVSPVVVREFLTSDRTQMFFHGHSFTAHPLACSVARANWRTMIGGSWQLSVDRIHQFWRRHELEWQQKPGVREVRIQGTIIAVEMDTPGGYVSDLGPRMRRVALAEGVLLRPLGNVVYALPPYCTSEASLQQIVHAIDRCREESQRG